MNLMIFTDAEGDPVVVASEQICSIRVGRVQESDQTVTLIRTTGGTDAVREPLAAVLRIWTTARGSASRPSPLGVDGGGY